MADEASVSVLYVMALADLGRAPDRPLHRAETDELMRCLRDEADPMEAALEVLEMAVIIRTDGLAEMATSILDVVARTIASAPPLVEDVNDDDVARTQARFRNFEGRPPALQTAHDERSAHVVATLKPVFKA